MSDHTDLLCELLTSSLIRGIQMGEMSEPGWLIGLVKHAICAYICCYFQFKKKTVIPSFIHHRQNVLESRNNRLNNTLGGQERAQIVHPLTLWQIGGCWAD
jgi:hypothetical protein